MGYALVFLSLGVTMAAVFLAGDLPGVPFWAFVVAAVAVSAPLMVAGGGSTAPAGGGYWG